GWLLSIAAARYGRNPALAIKPTFRTLTTTYEELEQLALRTGRLLQERGVRKGDRVLIWAPNTPAWVAAFFGCQKIGAITLPLDVRTSPSFAASIVRQTEPRLAFLSRQTAVESEGLGVPVVLLEELESALPPTAALIEEPAISPSDLAEIMFTSGTTGDPK